MLGPPPRWGGAEGHDFRDALSGVAQLVVVPVHELTGHDAAQAVANHGEVAVGGQGQDAVRDGPRHRGDVEVERVEPRVAEGMGYEDGRPRPVVRQRVQGHELLAGVLSAAVVVVHAIET